jgi:D-alanyl-D-alanine carboxypeptidase (penicillin-binding protein 5/6)
VISTVEAVKQRRYNAVILKIVRLFLWSWLGLFCNVLRAEGVPVELLPPAPTLNAKAWLLRDFRNGQVIAQHGAQQRIAPASLTKIMTAYLVFEDLKAERVQLQQVFNVSEKAWRMEGSRMFIHPGKDVSVEELLMGLIVQSGNDACIALAEGTSGNEVLFVERMNKVAKRLGMTSTHFVNSTGLPDPKHYSTAFDLSTLAIALIWTFPEFYRYYSTREYTYNDITQPNRNRLLWQDAHVDGVKTGHTESTGFSLIASAKRDAMRLVSVVVGAATDQKRATESQKLLNYGFQYFSTDRLYAKGQTVAELKVWKGDEDTVKAGFNRDFYVTLPRGHYSRLKATLTSQQPLLAPLTQGQKVGSLQLKLGDQPLGEYAVVSLEEIGIANVFVRLWDSLKLLFK